MESIHIYFCDFWNGFNNQSNIFIDALKYNYDVIVDDHVTTETNLIIYSCFANEYLMYPTIKKLYYSGENDYPNFNECDYAIGHVVMDGFKRYMRLPLWVIYERDAKYYIEQHPHYDNSYANRKFCAAVVSNKQFAWPLRDKVMFKISEYKQVDNGGRLYNNVGGPVEDKLEFLSNYKFSIASENSDVDGYVTEKLYEAFKANTVPIYLGSNYATHDFNKDAFINVNDFTSYNDLITRIKQLDEDDNLYMQMLNQPRFYSNTPFDDYYNDLVVFMKDVINGKKYNHKYGRIGIKWSTMQYYTTNK